MHVGWNQIKWAVTHADHKTVIWIWWGNDTHTQADRRIRGLPRPEKKLEN